MKSSRTAVVVLIISVVASIIFVILIGVVWFLLAIRASGVTAARRWPGPFIIVAVLITTITITATIVVLFLLFVVCVLFFLFDHPWHVLWIFRLWRAFWHRRFTFRVVRCCIFIRSVRSINECVEQRLCFFLRDDFCASVEELIEHAAARRLCRFVVAFCHKHLLHLFNQHSSRNLCHSS